MAEELKTEVEAEEIADLSKAMDDAISAKSEEEAKKDEKSEEQKPQKSNDGWLTSLPKELRDGIDTSKYSSLGEYVKSLQENQRIEAEVTNEDYENQWNAYKTDMEAKTDDAVKKESVSRLVEAFKGHKFSVDNVKHVLEPYLEEERKLEEAESSKKKVKYESYISENWKGRMKENFSLAERGIREMAGKNPRMLAMIREEGLENHPAIMEMLREVGLRTSESSIGKGGKVSTDYDPADPLGFRRS